MILLLVLIITVAVLFYKWTTANNDHFERKGIAFLKQNFLLGLIDIFVNKLSFPNVILKRYNQLEHESISGHFEFTRPIYFVRDPKLVKQMTVKDFEYFLDHRSMVDENIDKLFGKALISLKGQKWRDMRATLSPMFTGSKMRMMYDYVAHVGKQSAKTMQEQIESGSDNVFEFKALAMKFTVDVIASCAFGIEVNSFKNPENEFHIIASKVTNFFSPKTLLKFFGYMTVPLLMKALKIKFFDKDIEVFFSKAIPETMKTREEKGIVRHDLINLLIQAKKGKLSHDDKAEEKIAEGFATVEESNLGKSQVKRIWGDDDLAAQAFIFFFAGFETVATTMTFVAYELAINPEVQEKLYDEVQAMHNDLDGNNINYEQIQGLKYMDQVMSETLRKWPALLVTERVCVKDYPFDYDGKKFTFEKDLSIMIPIYGFHMDPLYYSEPEKFDPDRFNEENRTKIDPDTYMPFGLGPRSCIGSRFALMEIKTVFFYLLLNFSIEVTEKTQIPLQFTANPIGFKTEKGVWVALKPRE